MMQTSMPGMTAEFGAAPRNAWQSDVIKVQDINQQNGSALRKVYDQMPEPRYVISMEAVQTVVVVHHYSVVRGCDKIVQ